MINNTIKILLLRFMLKYYYQFQVDMDRRKFLTYIGCGCGSILLNSCSTAPITDRKQLKIIPEAKLNAQAAQIMKKLKKKKK